MTITGFYSLDRSPSTIAAIADRNASLIRRGADTEFLVDEQVDTFRFLEENERVITAGGRAASSGRLRLGITKASLSTDSFISAASFRLGSERADFARWGGGTAIYDKLYARVLAGLKE